MNNDNKKMLIYTLVLKLGGNSEHIRQDCSKIGGFQRKNPIWDCYRSNRIPLIDQLEQSLLLASAPISELPASIGTMTSTNNTRIRYMGLVRVFCFAGFLRGIFFLSKT